MLTKLKRMFLLVMFAAFALVLIGCGGKKPADPNEPGDQPGDQPGETLEEQLQAALDAVVVEAEVFEDFILDDVYFDDAETVWTSNNEEVIKLDGTYAEVFRPSGSDVVVKLTATVTVGDVELSKEFDVKVLKYAAPEAIKINVVRGLKLDDTQEGVYLLVKGAEAQLEIEVEEGEDVNVTWTVSRSKYASITEEGVLTGLDYGKFTVTATSKSINEDGSQTRATIEIEVVEDYNPNQVILNNKNYIESLIPEYISETCFLPVPENKEVEAVYTDSLGLELWDAEYIYIEGVDRQETIHCTLTYRGEETVFEIPLKIVSDPERNEFLALDYAEGKIDEIFAGFVGFGAPKVDGNFEVPETFSAEDALFDVIVEYDQVTDYQPNPIKFDYIEEAVEEGSAEEPAKTYNLIYTKPNDDAAVRIEVYMKTANVDRVVRYNVTAAGYTKEEIIEYLKENSFPKQIEGKYATTGAHVSLASGDTTGKFAATALSIAWQSSNEEVLTSAGKFKNPYLAATEQVKLTATVDYKGTVGAQFAFTEVVEFDFEVNPAANTAQAIALELSGYLETEEFMAQISHFPFGKADRLDDEGNISNVLPLPSKISDVTTEAMADYQDLVITWTCGEEGTIDENYKLLKQYLRYHEVALTYAVEYEGNVATNEIIINIGITETKNTIYIGGNYYQQKATGDVAGDVLCQLSKFDSPQGSFDSNGPKTWGYSYSHGEFNGYTWYIDVEGVRYQYFAAVNGFMTLDDQYNIDVTDPANPVITLNEELNANIGTNYGGNWASIYHNITDHEVQVPLSPYTGGASPWLDADGVQINWTAHPNNKSNAIDRENAFGMDGYRVGFVADAEGKVVFGNGEGVIQAIEQPTNSDGQMTADDFWITIPAGGFAYTTKTQQNNASIMGKFCVVDTVLNIQYFEPYQLSADGSAEGLGTFVHE